ncbi:MAG: Prophage minor tail protein [Planctomycetota bacterium]|jgi:hypothetical protein
MSGGALGVTLDAERLADMADRIGAVDSDITLAVRAAANHAARLAQRMGKARLNKGLSVSAETLRRRLKATTARGYRASGQVRFSSAQADANLRARARVWFGLNPVDPFNLSTPPVWASNRSTRSSGVTAGRYRWDGAFIGRRKKGNTGEAGSPAVFMRKGPKRLPIIRQFADINAESLAIITSEIFPLIADEFYRRFDLELVKAMEKRVAAEEYLANRGKR